MFFRKGEAWAIVEGRKHATYKTKFPKQKIGKIYAVQVAPPKGQKPAPGSTLGSIRITHITPVRLGEVSTADAQRAGLMDLNRFKQRWLEAGRDWDVARTVYRIEFELVSADKPVAVPT